MNSTTKVKVQTTTCKIAILYTDNSSEIKDVLLIGKYTLSKAKKYFKECGDIANAKNIEVLGVDSTQVSYMVDTIELNNWCNEHKIDEQHN